MPLAEQLFGSAKPLIIVLFGAVAAAVLIASAVAGCLVPAWQASRPAPGLQARR